MSDVDVNPASLYAASGNLQDAADQVRMSENTIGGADVDPGSHTVFGYALGFDAVGRAYDEELAAVRKRLQRLHVCTYASAEALKASARTYENVDHI